MKERQTKDNIAESREVGDAQSVLVIVFPKRMATDRVVVLPRPHKVCWTLTALSVYLQGKKRSYVAHCFLISYN
uniref:Uncharacterized protein n=1 Tax=Arion vulgaris TaxID=1028688 RepID=A0A0B6ZRD0_9EUPU